MATQSQAAASMHRAGHAFRPKVAIPSVRRPRIGKDKPIDREDASGVSSPRLVTRRTRKGAPRTRTGCQTCKIRHTKCDETRPSCTKCTSTGRKCDFIQLPISKSRAPTPPPRSSSLLSRRSIPFQPDSNPRAPLSPFNLTEQDGHYFQYFLGIATSGFFNAIQSPIWSLILQVSQTEPCIRHVALGTAILHQLYPYIIENPGDPSYIPIYNSALRHYANSVRCLKERLDNVHGKADRATWEVSIIASYLFTSFEVLIGNEDGAHWQNLNGFKLMRSALKIYGASPNQLELPGNLKEIALGFNRRDIQASTFGLGYETQVLLTPNVPDIFTSWHQASTALEMLQPNILSLIRLYGPGWYSNRSPDEPLPENLDSKLEELKALLQRWLHTFQKYLVFHDSIASNIPAGTQKVQEQIARRTLMVQYWTAFIWLHTPFSPTQIVHDPYLPQFTQIADLAEEVLNIRPERKFQYSSDNEIIQPLFYVAQKCRDGKLRRRAMGLLARSGREGVWDGQCAAAAASWIIAKEEEGLKDGIVGSVVEGTEGFVEERFRLRGSLITVNRLAKSLNVCATRINEEGAEYWISGSTGWGEGAREIVYGESDKLWQKGLLFG